MDGTHFSVCVRGDEKGEKGTVTAHRKLCGFVATSLMLENVFFDVKYNKVNTQDEFLIDSPFKFVVVLCQTGIVDACKFLNRQLLVNKEFRSFLFKISCNSDLDESKGQEQMQSKEKELFKTTCTTLIQHSKYNEFSHGRKIKTETVGFTAIEYLTLLLGKNQRRSARFIHPDKKSPDDTRTLKFTQEFQHRTDISSTLITFMNKVGHPKPEKREQVYFPSIQPDLKQVMKQLANLFFKIFGSCEFVETAETQIFHIFSDDVKLIFPPAQLFSCDDFSFGYGQCKNNGQNVFQVASYPERYWSR